MAWSQKVFYFGSNLQKKVPNHSPALLLFRWTVLRAVIGTYFEIGAEAKTSLRLNHLYPPHLCVQRRISKFNPEGNWSVDNRKYWVQKFQPFCETAPMYDKQIRILFNIHYIACLKNRNKFCSFETWIHSWIKLFRLEIIAQHHSNVDGSKFNLKEK